MAVLFGMVRRRPDVQNTPAQHRARMPPPEPRNLQELYAFLTTQTVSQLIVDRSSPNELLKINFNIRYGGLHKGHLQIAIYKLMLLPAALGHRSFPALSCEFATLDVSDALGTVGISRPHAIGLTDL